MTTQVVFLLPCFCCVGRPQSIGLSCITASPATRSSIRIRQLKDWHDVQDSGSVPPTACALPATLPQSSQPLPPVRASPNDWQSFDETTRKYLMRMKKEELVRWAQRASVDSTGTKADIVERLMQHAVCTRLLQCVVRDTRLITAATRP